MANVNRSSSILSHLCFLFSLHGLVVNISLEEKFTTFINGKNYVCETLTPIEYSYHWKILLLEILLLLRRYRGEEGPALFSVA